MAKVAIIVYSTYGHLYALAKEIKKGVDSTGLTADLYVVPETLPGDVLEKMHAAPVDKDFKVASTKTLEEYDAFLFGVPTRFGNMPAQWADFWGATGGLWASGALYHKFAGVFVSSGTMGGGQEVTVRNYMSILAHHGIVYIPLGYGKTFAQLTSFDKPHGASPWGAGLFAGPDGSRSANEIELEIAKIQGSEFAKVIKEKFGDSTDSVAQKQESETSDGKGSAVKARESQSTKGKTESSIGCAKCVIM